MNSEFVNLAEEWRKRRTRQIWEAQLWVSVLGIGVVGVILPTVLLIWKVPQISREKASWAKRVERALNAQQENAAAPMPLSPSQLALTRTRCTEFSLSLMATMRLIPREVWLQELQIGFSEEVGLTTSLRGQTQDFDGVKTYTDRLRQAGVFSDVVPVSVNRGDPNQPDARINYEIRLTMPTADSAGSSSSQEVSDS